MVRKHSDAKMFGMVENTTEESVTLGTAQFYPTEGGIY